MEYIVFKTEKRKIKKAGEQYWDEIKKTILTATEPTRVKKIVITKYCGITTYLSLLEASIERENRKNNAPD